MLRNIGPGVEQEYPYKNERSKYTLTSYLTMSPALHAIAVFLDLSTAFHKVAVLMLASGTSNKKYTS